MKIAVIVLNYNTAKDCEKCISFLRRQIGVEIEIIVVDNSSQIEDVKQLRQVCSENGCTLIENYENRGYNAGNNIGLRYAASQGYKYALIANPDMEFPQVDYIENLTNVMAQYSDVVVVGSSIIGVDGKQQNPLKKDGNWTNSFDWIIELVTRKKSTWVDHPETSHYCSKVSGCCLMVQMDFIRQIGFFDEYPFLYCEEAILSRQVEMMGKHMYYTIEAQAIHRHIPSTKGNRFKRFQYWKHSRLYFINHYSNDSWLGKKIASFAVVLYANLFAISKRK